MNHKLIGPAGKAQAFMEKAVAYSKANDNSPLMFLIHGPPGVGKSTLATCLQNALGVDKWSTHKYSGTQVKLETVEELARCLYLTSLFGVWRLLVIDEVDYMPRIAQVRFLTLLDDIPNGVAVVCTCNKNVKDLEDRFQSRFQPIALCSPTQDEISAWLQGDHGLPKADADMIALSSCGNVRMALKDATSWKMCAS